MSKITTTTTVLSVMSPPIHQMPTVSSVRKIAQFETIPKNITLGVRSPVGAQRSAGRSRSKLASIFFNLFA